MSLSTTRVARRAYKVDGDPFLYSSIVPFFVQFLKCNSLSVADQIHLFLFPLLSFSPSHSSNDLLALKSVLQKFFHN